ncbi:MAG: hypothetical protein ACM3ST_01120 [Bdellovibrio bacteriovorus]
MATLLDYSGLYQLLTDFVGKKRTGTILGKTDTNNSVIIGFRGGEVVSLICAGRRGRSAIAAIRKITAVTVRIEDSATPSSAADMPATADIMHGLSPWTSLEEAAPAPSPGQGGDGSGLCDLLSQFIGPIAPVLCSEAISAVGGLGDEARKQQVILTLAKEIENEREATQFIERARRLLGAG